MTETIIKDKKIAIIGGGPGGLSLARLLQIRGASVTVYERDISPAARLQGGSLDLHEQSGRKVIEAAGLIEAYQSKARSEGGRLKIYDKKGSLILDTSADSEAGAKPEIDRGDLRDLLVNSLSPGTILWNHHFIALSKKGDKFELTFKGQYKTTADLIIGSDGARSKVRPYITDILPQYSGTTLIQGEVENPEKKCPEIFRMVDQGTIVILGGEKALIIQQKGDGNLIFYSTARQPQNWICTSYIDFTINQEVISFLEFIHADWNPLFIRLFSASFEFVPRPMYATPIDQSWETKQNITIIGDAAHVMPPFAGVGVNMAMIDAFELADCLTNGNHSSLMKALQVYETGMLARTAEAQTMTKDSEEIFHSPNAVEELAIRLKENQTP